MSALASLKTSENSPIMSNETDKSFILSARRWPKLTAALAAMLVAIPASGLGISMLSPFLNVAEHQTTMIWAGGTTGVLGAISTFLLLAHRFGADIPKKALPFAFAVLGMLVAIMAGQAATVIAFGEAGPWGDIADGVTGPLTNGVAALENAVEWWPMPFAFAFIATLMAVGWAWDQTLSLEQSDTI